MMERKVVRSTSGFLTVLVPLFLSLPQPWAGKCKHPRFAKSDPPLYVTPESTV